MGPTGHAEPRVAANGGQATARQNICSSAHLRTGIPSQVHAARRHITPRTGVEREREREESAFFCFCFCLPACLPHTAAAAPTTPIATTPHLHLSSLIAVGRPAAPSPATAIDRSLLPVPPASQGKDSASPPIRPGCRLKSSPDRIWYVLSSTPRFLAPCSSILFFISNLLRLRFIIYASVRLFRFIVTVLNFTNSTCLHPCSTLLNVCLDSY